MRYLIIVRPGERGETGAQPSPELAAAHGRYAEELTSKGVMVMGGGLHPSARGKRIRFSPGRKSVIDGPFAETKELIGGFWICEAGSLDEAVEWVKQTPGPEEGEMEIEIRQIASPDDWE